jgi:hypothetical protein
VGSRTLHAVTPATNLGCPTRTRQLAHSQVKAAAFERVGTVGCAREGGGAPTEVGSLSRVLTTWTYSTYAAPCVGGVHC